MPVCHYRRLGVAAPALLSALLIVLGSCTGNRNQQIETTFTAADSLTDQFLQLQDSMLYAWNRLVNDDTRKIRSMHELLHELMTDGGYDQGMLIALEHRLNTLTTLPITQESINNATLVEEYDFTTASLVTELVSLARSHDSFAEDAKLNEMVQDILLIDQRVEANRRYYDDITSDYNRFLENHAQLAAEIGLNTPLTKKPLFEMASDQ